MSATNFSRRQVLKGSAAAMAMGAIGSLGGLYSRQALAATGNPWSAPVSSPYGALAPVADQSTGLPLLLLPAGFSYASFSWTGDRLADGQPAPSKHDGMAVMRGHGNALGVGRHGRGNGHGPDMVIVRNHEVGASTTPIIAPGTYDRGAINASGMRAGGGTTTLRFRDGKWLDAEASLAGTVVNCAGGRTPWGTWLTCEEIKSNAISGEGRKHGYVFEVHPDAEQTTGRPLVALGRFSHEAVAIDPRTGYLYLTEDDRNKSGFYRFIPNDRAGRPGSLENGGRLQAARVRGRPNMDLVTARIGDEFQLEWVDIRDPDLDSALAPAGFKDIGAGETLSGPFAQGWSEGALRMSRGEGIFHADGKMFIVDTSTGVDVNGRRGRGYGAVWVLDLATQRLSALFVSGDQSAAHNPDNITVSPRGGVVLCEDPDAAPSGSPDAFGPGTRLVGLTRSGEPFCLLKNNVELTDSQIASAGKVIAEGDYRDSEFAGACWSPDGRTLFVNVQTPGITLAITGPWMDGPL
ncbi:alkaline phosphatase PhoX [Lysobacter niabensis]|uniref:alkaline phosphatase PhoX n=1 Tax=Agrilutibacter niabensis TaxID=380628 RepID=UPI0036231D5B